MQKIVMTNGVAMLVEETVTDIVDLDEFRRGISLNAVSTPVLPFGCIYYSEKDNNQILCVVRKAEVIDVNNANRMYKVALPHRLYTFSVRNGQLRGILQHFILAMPKDLKEEVFDAPFPNRTSDGSLCQSGVMMSNSKESLTFRVDHVVNQVERTRFNTDHISAAKQAMPSLFAEGAGGQYTQMLAKWKAWTEEHEETWEASLKDIPWKKIGTLGQLIDGRR